jgi:hypothetical protein
MFKNKENIIRNEYQVTTLNKVSTKTPLRR